MRGGPTYIRIDPPQTASKCRDPCIDDRCHISQQKQAEGETGMIRGVIIVNNHGKPRLVKFYQTVVSQGSKPPLRTWGAGAKLISPLPTPDNKISPLRASGFRTLLFAFRLHTPHLHPSTHHLYEQRTQLPLCIWYLALCPRRCLHNAKPAFWWLRFSLLYGYPLFP